jgi:hypothetical protein
VEHKLTVTERAVLAQTYVLAMSALEDADGIAAVQRAEAHLAYDHRDDLPGVVRAGMLANRLAHSTPEMVRAAARRRLREVFETVKPIMERAGYQYDGDHYDDGKFVSQTAMFAFDLGQAVDLVTGQDFRDHDAELGH